MLLRVDRTRALAGVSLSAVAALVVTVLGPTNSAFSVAPAQPTNLSVQQPNDSTSVLSWDHVAGATQYQLQVDDDPNFGSPALIPSALITTVNNTYVPTANLPAGDKYWRVRARNATNEDSPWSISQFGNPSVKVPQPASPPDNTTLSQPSQPPLLTWSTSPGATKYIVEVDGDSDFVGAVAVETASTSLVWPNPLPAGTIANPADYYWRVTASKGSGLNSQPSPASRFIIGPLAAPTLTSPPSDPNFELQDVVMDWEPVPGAKSYDVEVALNQTFTTIVESKTGITGTRYSPVISYDNDQYYWRVRARDLDNQPTPWTESLYDYNRTWPHQPQAVFPAETGIETVTTPIYFEWTSVPHASEYEIQLSTTPGFTELTTSSCRTAGTTYTPGMFAINTVGNGIPSTLRFEEDCEPRPGTVNYWKVRPLDRPYDKQGSGDLPGIQGIYSAVQSFLWDPVQVSGMSPAPGATVDRASFSWDAAPGAESYTVVVKNNMELEVDRNKTFATSYTVDTITPLPTSGNPYTWQLNATTADGVSSVIYTQSFNVSGNAPPVPPNPADYLKPITGTLADGPYETAPALSWQPIPGATSYRVNVGYSMDSGQIYFAHAPGQDLFNQSMPYNAFTDIGPRLLLPGTYDWQVSAYGPGGWIADGPEGRFTVADVAPTSEHALAIGGRELDGNNPAVKTPCDPLSGPCVVPTTPVLKWKAQQYASFYMVYVSRDASFTNLLEPANAIPATTNSMYAPALDNQSWTYPDTEAGEALYWHIRPCRKVNNCADSPVSTLGRSQHSFTKTSPKVAGLTSTDPSKSEITFSWNDYFDTNRSAQWAQTGEDRPQSAMQYRIQVDDVESFGTGTALVDERIVDQATYTAFDNLYPEGQLYWRVQAIDSKGDINGNGRLAWSDTKTFVKASPRVELLGPVDGATVPGTVALRWKPQGFAGSYKVEVYKNNDTTFSQPNRVVQATVRTPAYAPLAPLPVSSEPYVWRVQRIDTDGNAGPWSWGGTPDSGGNPVGRFSVGTGLMEITSPAPGGVQPPNGPILTWRDFPGAVKYTVDISSPSGGFAATAQTVALAYAPTINFATGTYPWKVTAFDASNNQIGNASSTFTVDARVIATAPPEIQAPSGTGVGATLTSTPPSWNQADVAMTYQWLRDGQAILGATGTTYVLTTADFGKAISLRVTGKKSGFSDGVTVSSPIGTTAGGALQATVQPTITGTPKVGSLLQVTAGTWSQPSPTLKYQWLRTGAPIPGATTSIYKLAPEDAGKDVSVTVLASKSGYADGSASAQAVAIAKMTSTTTSAFSSLRVKRGKTVKVGVTVVIPGVLTPSGVMKIQDGVKTIKTFTMDPFRKGKMTVKLATKKLKVGRHKIKVVFTGNASTDMSKSKVVRLIIIK